MDRRRCRHPSDRSTAPEIPDGTYYTAQIVDEWAEITVNINDRTFPDTPNGDFALCLAGSDPEIPDDAVRLDLPSPKAKLLARVQIGDDVQAAVDLQHGFGLRSTGTPRIEPAVAYAPFTNQQPPGAALFARPQLEQAMAPLDRQRSRRHVRPGASSASPTSSPPIRTTPRRSTTRCAPTSSRR